MSSVTDDLDQRLAAELDRARNLLLAMGDELADSDAVIAEHGVALQAVDIVGQILGHIANVVRANDRTAAIESIGMGELKAKLAAA
jgi:hypothetical protein